MQLGAQLQLQRSGSEPECPLEPRWVQHNFGRRHGGGQCMDHLKQQATNIKQTSNCCKGTASLSISQPSRQPVSTDARRHGLANAAVISHRGRRPVPARLDGAAVIWAVVHGCVVRRCVGLRDVVCGWRCGCVTCQCHVRLSRAAVTCRCHFVSPSYALSGLFVSYSFVSLHVHIVVCNVLYVQSVTE